MLKASKHLPRFVPYHRGTESLNLHWHWYSHRHRIALVKATQSTYHSPILVSSWVITLSDRACLMRPVESQRPQARTYLAKTPDPNRRGEMTIHETNAWTCNLICSPESHLKKKGPCPSLPFPFQGSPESPCCLPRRRSCTDLSCLGSEV